MTNPTDFPTLILSTAAVLAGCLGLMYAGRSWIATRTFKEELAQEAQAQARLEAMKRHPSYQSRR